ncbi:MAG: hypothetical protein FLDDKLPJ_01915 [Phycisphaerae bacterium]|nr:hypothetical protein [Phycisphaerae bacterium]
MTQLGGCGGALVAVTVLSSAALAHDFWIEPSTYFPASGEAIHVRLQVGDHFKGEPVARNDDRIERFELVGAGGGKPVVGRSGDDPAGVTRATTPGAATIVYVGRPSTIELEAAKFEAYLKEEGLDHVIEERAKRGESAKAGTEAYSRSVKCLLRVGESETQGFDRIAGLPLEIVPLQDPWAKKPGERLTVQVLQDGKPLGGVQVEAWRAGQTEAAPKSARTDSEGKVALTLDAPGTWMFTSVYMRRNEGGKEDWRSTWTSLTFEVPAAASPSAPADGNKTAP